jgi:hypothetical protein
VTAAEVVARFLEREMRTLSELERCLGASLARDPSGEEAWLVRRKEPVPGVSFVFVALLGRDLAGEADPMLDEVRLFTTDLDCRSAAVRLLGPGVRIGGETTDDPYHGTSITSPLATTWQGERGTLTVHDDSPQRIFWERRDFPFETAWATGDEELVLSQVRSLVGGPLEEARIESAFGPLVTSGRFPLRFRRGPTWKVSVHPVSGAPEQTLIAFSPELPVDRVLAGLGWGPMLVATRGVHQSAAHVIDPTTRRPPVLGGVRVSVSVSSVGGGRRSDVRVPAQRVYETAGLMTNGIELTPP